MARSKRWVVEGRSPILLHEILARIGADASALSDGRVFVDRVRAARADTNLTPGTVVEVFLPTTPSGAEPPAILARRGGIIAAYKPAGIPTIPDQRGTSDTLLAFVARETGRREPSEVHTSSRLDTEVSGVVLLAIDESARRLLRAAREQGEYQRHYIALSAVAPTPAQGLCDAPIGRASDPRKRRIGGPEAVPAATRYRTAAVTPHCAMIAAEPQTGRTHQIRLHLSHCGAPLIGDPAYGGKRSIVLPTGAVRELPRIALHAAWVQLGKWRVEAEVPRELRALWEGLGGKDSEWEGAL